MANNQLIQFYNCRIIRNHQIVVDDLWLRNGKIINPEPVYYVEKRVADIRINCHNRIIAPGYIDLQINGGFGYDFSNCGKQIVDAIDKVAVGLIAHGVTSFCPTLVTLPSDTYKQILPHAKRRNGCKSKGSNVLGLHLEGPFISSSKRGAHSREHVYDKPIESVKTLLDYYGDISQVSIITIAPEFDTGSIIKYLSARDIVVSIGHSASNLQTGELAIKNGCRFITHLFNAMLPFHHRDPGLIGLLARDFSVENADGNKEIIDLNNNELNSESKESNIGIMVDNGYDNVEKLPLSHIYYGIIADGFHTHETAIKIAYRTNPQGLVLVTDAVAPLGLPSGCTHRIGEQLIEIKDNAGYIVGTNTLCGSIASMDKCVRNLRMATGCSLVQAIECATLHPAEVLGIQKTKGTLNFGSDADLVMLDDNLIVHSTYIDGELVWQKD